MTETCGNCRYSYTGARNIIYCRRYPPLAKGDQIYVEASIFPHVNSNDWCGEWTFNKKLEMNSEGGST